MKYLKITLADGKNYILSTFTMLELTTVKKEYKKFEETENEKDRINFETDERGKIKKDDKGKWIIREDRTPEQINRLEEIEEFQIQFGMDILGKSLAYKQKEFKKTGDKEKDKAIQEKLMSLIDVDGLRKIINFAASGSYIQENNMIEDIVLDVSEDIEDVEEKK